MASGHADKHLPIEVEHGRPSPQTYCIVTYDHVTYRNAMLTLATAAVAL